MSAEHSAAPRPLRVAAVVVAVEGLAAVGAGLTFLVMSLIGKPADRPTAVTLAVLLVLVGAGLGAAAHGLWRRRPAAQTPSYLAQFFTLVVAYYQRHTLVGVTLALAAAAVVALAALSAPESREALRRQPSGR